MKPHGALESLRGEIEREERNLAAMASNDRHRDVVALLEAQNRIFSGASTGSVPDLVFGYRLVMPGGNEALRVCLDSHTDITPDHESRARGDDWAERFLRAWDALVTVKTIVSHCDDGFMRLEQSEPERYDAWIARKLMPAAWRERADYEWWATRLINGQPAEAPFPRSANVQPGVATDEPDRGVARTMLQTMAYQLTLPPLAVVDGAPIQMYRDVLVELIGLAIRGRKRGHASGVEREDALVPRISSVLAYEPDRVRDLVAAFTLDDHNARYHAATPGVAPAPLVRVGHGDIAWSFSGLTSEPLLFLQRELRRRNAASYHNAAHLREEVFREDLYGLFRDRRFVLSARGIELRGDQGTARTDIDAAVFDKKTGVLGLFELKSHDPFARSRDERIRQRGNLLHANRQVSSILAWVRQHGADEILNRTDRKTAKSFRVRRVYPFVLGRYLAHFPDGPPPDTRAAWGTWSQVLRWSDRVSRQAPSNPIASLFNELHQATPLDLDVGGLPAFEIHLGSSRLFVHGSYSAYQERTANEVWR